MDYIKLPESTCAVLLFKKKKKSKVFDYRF